MAVCKACGKPLVFIETPNGKWMPCDEGMVEYWLDGAETLVDKRGNIIHCRTEGEGKPDGLARRPHWASCTGSDLFRKERDGHSRED